MHFDSILQTVELLSKLESALSNRHCFINQVSFINWILCCHFKCAYHLHRNRFHLKKSLSLPISQQLLILSSLIMKLQPICQALILILILILYLSYQQLLPPMKSWPRQSHPQGLKSTSSKLLILLIFWPIPMNHKRSSWHVEWWILSKRFPTYFPQSHHKAHYGSYSLTKCIS